MAKGRTTKLFPLPHLSGILAGSGNLVMLLPYLAACCADGADFDALAAKAVDMAADTYGRVRAAAAADPAARNVDITKQCLFLAGWSRSRGQMAALCLEQ